MLTLTKFDSWYTMSSFPNLFDTISSRRAPTFPSDIRMFDHSTILACLLAIVCGIHSRLAD
jgi:hypothetical protein